MKSWTKAATYLAVIGLSVFFAFQLSRAHALAAGASSSTSPLWLTLLVVSLIVLGVLCVLDLKTFIKSRAEGWMLQAGVPNEAVPELEEAQKMRAAGEPLDAIRLLREYLQANPYEIHVMSRIAEIYRYDLKNDLAAALEYEEMLKHKLPDDQWAWAALHLAKLYGRLNELEKSLALLERLDSAYGHTIAGRRAKKALEQARDPGAPGSDEDEESGAAEGA
jgi:tetratricopeptide (TPR) repeat protein